MQAVGSAAQQAPEGRQDEQHQRKEITFVGAAERSRAKVDNRADDIQPVCA